MTSSRKSKIECCIVNYPSCSEFWVNVYEDNTPIDLEMKKFSSLEEIAIILSLHFPGCSVERSAKPGIYLQYFYVHGIPEKVLREHFRNGIPLI